MPNRLAGAVSPYLRSHAQNPVDWQPWSADAFDEARRRDVPVLVSIGYSTCHWCHVMARESFSDPALAAQLNDGFVAIKVDREEHPDVDASYLAAAGAFTEHLGWPLNVFVTPDGRAFFAGTYWPPEAVAGHPAFRDVLTAVTDAWTERRAEVDQNAAAIVAALQSSGVDAAGSAPLDGPALDALVLELVAQEDSLHGGFGGAPKFPVAPVIAFLLERGVAGNEAAGALASRSLAALAGVALPSDLTYAALRDRVGGGLFRYATRADWSEPHFERMLYDNAQLLESFVRLEVARPGLPGVRDVADGIGAFLLDVLERPGGGFASAQDSESTVDGSRVEGAYFELTAAERKRQPPPAVDDKVLTGWNGLAVSALAIGGFRFGRPQWVEAARRAADFLLAQHRLGDGTLVRASVDDVTSTAKATLEDYGMFAQGLLDLATASGEVRYATAARELIDATIAAGGVQPFGVPGGADPVLAAQGLVLEVDPSEGAYPSGLSAMAGASLTLYLLTGFDRYREAAQRTIDLLAPLAVRRPMAFGATLTVASRLTAPITQLVVVATTGGSEVASVARSWSGAGALVCALTAAQALEFAEAGFGLFAGRVREAAYLCHHFVCRLPLTDPAALQEALRS